MIVRVLALLVTAALVIGAATQLGWAFDDEAGYSIDDDPAIATTATTVVTADRQPTPIAWEVAGSPGRLHAVSVFRPPRT